MKDSRAPKHKFLPSAPKQMANLSGEARYICFLCLTDGSARTP
jgi:hypothetical protein